MPPVRKKVKHIFLYKDVSLYTAVYKNLFLRILTNISIFLYDPIRNLFQKITRKEGQGVRREKFLTPEDVAEELSVSPLSVRHWLRTGRLKGSKISNLWRIKESDLDKFIEQADKHTHKEEETL